MSPFGELGYLALGGVLATEWLVLHALVREIAALKRRYITADEPSEPRSHLLSHPAPPFRMRQLGSPDILDNEAIQGRNTVLLFLAPANLSAFDPLVPTVLHAISHKVDGPVYAVCSATDDECSRFRDAHNLERMFGPRVAVALDPGGELRARFSIDDELRAVWIDESGVIRKLGALSNESVEDFGEDELSADAGSQS